MIEVRFKCDICGSPTIGRRFWKYSKGESAHADRGKLVLEGWTCRSGGIDICPRCRIAGRRVSK
jgi:hypothetical protein